MNHEFVPLYLGANKGKDFYIDSVKMLHQMNDGELAVIEDGAYEIVEMFQKKFSISGINT